MPERAPSRDERALWRAATRDVTPLAGITPPPAAASPPAPAPTPDPQAPDPQAAARPRRRPAASPPARAAAAAPAAPGLDRRTGERLRRGQMAIEARLDLHGMTQAEAHRALGRFLAEAQEAGRRCVLVITGKGARRGGEDEGGVLRAAVPRWLGEAPNRLRLLATAPARPQHGGGGALYLLLRRRRAP